MFGFEGLLKSRNRKGSVSTLCIQKMKIATEKHIVGTNLGDNGDIGSTGPNCCSGDAALLGLLTDKGDEGGCGPNT